LFSDDLLETTVLRLKSFFLWRGVTKNVFSLFIAFLYNPVWPYMEEGRSVRKVSNVAKGPKFRPQNAKGDENIAGAGKICGRFFKQIYLKKGSTRA
jgi:hypothetical protein